MTALPDRLARFLTDHSPCGVLFSGGNDSEALLRAALQVMDPHRVIALTAVTPMLAGYCRKRIASITAELGVTSVFLHVNPLEVSGFRTNSPERCYVCKKLICSAPARQESISPSVNLMDGTCLNDLKEHRPGLAAADELGILHPFVDALMTKEDVLSLGRSMGMSPELNPSDSCLATRIAPPLPIEPRLLALVERLESPLRPLVRGRLRARIGQEGIVIEYSAGDSGAVLEKRTQLESVAAGSDFGIVFREIGPC